MLLKNLVNDNLHKKCDILVIDKSDTFEFICTSYKALVDEKEIDRLRVPVQQTMDSVY